MIPIRQTIQRLSKLITEQPIDFAIACSFVVVLALVELPLPIFMALLIDKIIPASDVTNLIIIGLFLFSIRLGSSVFQVMQNYLIAKIVNFFTANIQKDLIYRILRLPFQKFTSAEAHGMASRFNQDIDKVSEFAQNTIHFLIRPALSFIFIMALMLYWNAPLAFYCLLMVPIITLASRLIRTRMEAMAYEQRKLTERLEVRAVEALSNLKIIRTFTCENHFTDKVENEINQLETSSVKFQVWSELSNSLIEFIKSINNIGFIFFAAHQVFNGNLTIGGFIALQTMSEGLRSPLAQIMYYITNFKSKAVALEKINEVLTEQLEQPNNNKEIIPPIKDQITFEQVNLKIGEKQILNDVSFNIPKGHMVAFVGPSGAGKTTLTNLLIGLVKPTSGKIKIDHTDLSDADIYTFRSQTGVVYQDSILFNNTVRYNMKIGDPNASDDQIYQALTVANADDFIRNLPNGLDTVIGVNGIKLSGGQQQRLSIARAVLANPAIMILDEATSSLDSISENEIKTALDQSLRGRTSIIIAHRLSTIVNANKIYVMNAGKIVESGTHQSLLQNETGLYYKLYKTQTEKLIALS